MRQQSYELLASDLGKTWEVHMFGTKRRNEGQGPAVVASSDPVSLSVIHGTFLNSRAGTSVPASATTMRINVINGSHTEISADFFRQCALQTWFDLVCEARRSLADSHLPCRCSRG